MSDIKLLFLSGSTRSQSFNKKLANYAANFANDRGVKALFIDLADYPMPFYNGDEEEKNGLPENAVKLKQQFIESDGFFIASPEYNGSFSGLLKNALDWISRPSEANESALIAFKGKTAALSSTSPGPLGGLRGLVPLRMLLNNIHVHVITHQAALGSCHSAFDKEGNIVNESQKKMVENVVENLIVTTQKLS